MVPRLSGLLLSLLLLVGLFQLGIIGNLVLGVFILVGGGAAPLLMGGILLASLVLTISGHWPRPSVRRGLGSGLFLAGLLMFLHGQLFNQLGSHSHYLLTTGNRLSQALLNNDFSLNVGGGMLGGLLYSGTAYLLAPLGAWILASLLMVSGLVIFFNLPWERILLTVGAGLAAAVRGLQTVGSKLISWAKTVELPHPQTKQEVAPTTTDDQAPVVVHEATHPDAPVTSPKITVATQPTPVAPPTPVAKPAADEAAPLATAVNDADYRLPPTSLLTRIPPTNQDADLKAIKKNTALLTETLQSFGVQATVENVGLGPAVTKYELRPAVGVKVAKITHLADDLALALAAKDIRIEAPIPGKSLVGIEVPNQKIATVGFRDLVEAAPPNDRPLEVPLGRTVAGTVMTADLTRMPHLLIAGATGSGKSVAINVILTSILLRAKPSQVKLLLVDPKKVELSVYNGIPHLLSPVVSDPKKAARALGKVVTEMERRYDLFSQLGVRNLAGYNRQVQKAAATGEEAPHPLPLVLVVVDELADLMMTVSHEVEDAIVRIAQMGRAAGIHMILATQRPSVDVITGLIKANVPSRIAFAVSSGIDSRTILDANGAEKLLGRGDMLFQPIDQNKPTRVQGAFISDQDVEAVVSFIKEERPAEYDERMVVTDDEVASEEAAKEEDPLFKQALALVVDQQRASTSMIQRRFRIGYNRAARILDDMEQRGYVSPANGAKPREVYKQPEK